MLDLDRNVLKKQIKIAAFDVDGTILPNGITEFSDRTAKMFEELKKQNIITVIASAREFVTIGNLLDKVPTLDYFIGANGTFIYDVQNKKLVFEKVINFDDFKTIYEFFIKTKQCTGFTIMDTKYGFYSPGTNIDTWFLRPHHQKMIYVDYDKLEKDHMHIITLIAKGIENSNWCSKKANELIQKKHMDLEVNSLWTNGLFICPKGITKSETLNTLCKMLGYSRDNLIAFGDSSNDYEMIRDAFYGVAMDHSSDELKKVANDVALDCEYDGAYIKLQELKLI
ncbi:MAG: YcsE-related riboflavin metabolism phosphatase [Metamycoplasmataceae bacterium]|uniref:YcsE-related riboflavin metabolism phosphatase n=1 Tax=Mycoplasmopsis lipophila TaxID=2117 RepID=UPI003872B6E8